MAATPVVPNGPAVRVLRTPKRLCGTCSDTARGRKLKGMTVSSSTLEHSPKWAKGAAVAIPFTVLPSTLWRLALGFGVPVGFHGDLARLYAAPGWITLYVILLGAVSEGFALLSLGLVRPWGEVVPDWVPIVRGRRIPVMAAVIPAVVGALALIFITVVAVAEWNGPENNGDPDAPHGLAGVVMAAAYAPMLAWAPLLLLVTTAYYVRRRRQAPAHLTTRPLS